MSANGRVKPNTVVVSGVEAAYLVGHHELRSFEGSKTKWTKVTGNATEALAALHLAQRRANAVAFADDAGVRLVLDTKRRSIVLPLYSRLPHLLH
jgi:hypothetical protein